MTTVRTVVVWWAVTLGTLAAVYAAWFAAAAWGVRRAARRLEQARLERQARYAANAQASAIAAARKRHPTWHEPAAPPRKPASMPADQYEQLMSTYEAKVISMFKKDLAKLREVDE